MYLMYLKRSILILSAALIAAGSANAEIFRTIDKDGNPVFSDVPPPPDQKAESVKVEPVNTFVTPAAEDNGGFAAESAEDEVETYANVSILSPGNDETIRDNAGTVTVAVAMNPDLRAGDQLVLFMDGQPSTVAAQGTSFTLNNVDRGTHTVGVRVMDSSGRVAAEATPSTFHLQRVRL